MPPVLAVPGVARMSEGGFYRYHSLIVWVRRRFATLNYAETVFALAIKVFVIFQINPLKGLACQAFP
jgi:hypothetical protein